MHIELFRSCCFECPDAKFEPYGRPCIGFAHRPGFGLTCNFGYTRPTFGMRPNHNHNPAC